MYRVCCLFLLVLAAGCGKDAPASRTPAGGPPPAAKGPRAFRVTTTSVSARALTYEIAAVGAVEAADTVPVSARVEGTLSALAFDEGVAVTAETVLAEIDRDRYALEVRQVEAEIARQESAVARAVLQIAQSESTITRMRAQIARAEAACAEARANLDRRRELQSRDAGAVSREELATFEAAVAKAEAELEISRGSETESAAALKVVQAQADEARTVLAQAQVRLDLARRDLDDARVRSPIAGVVQTRHVTNGQWVRVGDRIATLVDVSRLRLRFRVDEAESVRLNLHQAVTFRVKAWPERAFDAEIFHIQATADPATRMVECLAEVARTDAGLKPGFFATVRMVVGRSEQAIVIPDESILPTERGFVAFVVEDGKARRRDLIAGLHTPDGGVEVLGGLAVGEQLVVQGAQMLQDGFAVDVVAPDAPSSLPSAK